MSTLPHTSALSRNQCLGWFAALVLVRALWSAGFGPSDGELLVWVSRDFASPFPAPFGLVALASPTVALLGDHPAALRLLFNVLAAAPVLMVGRHPAAVALAASLPILAVPGGLATSAAPLAVLWLAVVQLAPVRPGFAGVAAGLTAAFHPLGLLVAIPGWMRARQRWWLILTGAATAAPFLPGSLWSTTQPFTGELSPVGLALAALLLGGPLLLAGAVARIIQGHPQRVEAGCALVSIGAMVVTGAPLPLLAAPFALAIRAVAPDPDPNAPVPTAHRTAWHSVGISAVTAITLMAVLRMPLTPTQVDPRARFVDTATLAQTVDSWAFPTVYALSPADVARLRWHGVPATTPPPVHPLDLPDDVLLVMPQSADPDLPFHMGWDHERQSVSSVVAYLDSADPTKSRPAAAWTVTTWTRPPDRRR